MEKYEGKNLFFARHNRKTRNATPQERLLWHVYLKKSEINFSRQYRIGNYILDFYAPSVRLAIEIDGGQHYEDAAIAYDQERTAFLQSKGIVVLRFTNTEIDRNLDGVFVRIEQELARLKR